MSGAKCSSKKKAPDIKVREKLLLSALSTVQKAGSIGAPGHEFEPHVGHRVYFKLKNRSRWYLSVPHIWNLMCL